jgi:hypothetical protein
MHRELELKHFRIHLVITIRSLRLWRFSSNTILEELFETNVYEDEVGDCAERHCSRYRSGFGEICHHFRDAHASQSARLCRTIG